MSDSPIEPKFTTLIRFRMGAVLPSENPVAQWIVNLARASNDLIIAHNRLMRGFDEETPEEEHFYDMRSISTHSWELVKFIQESERDHPEIATFIAGLAPKVVQDYHDASELLDADPVELEPGKQWSFKVALISARDQSIHYSRIDHKLLKSALKRVADQEGQLLVGKDFKDFRAQFAATVDAQVFHPLNDDPEPFRRFSDQLQKVVGNLLRFSRNAIDTYLLEQKEHLTFEDYH